MSEATPKPRKTLARLRARQREGSEDGSVAGGTGTPSGTPATPSRGPHREEEQEEGPVATQVPQRMQVRGVAVPLGGTRPALSAEQLLVQREADRKKAIHSIAAEDLDKNALSVAETAQFLGFRFHDWADCVPVTFNSSFDPEVGRSGERIVFVENAETGAMEAREAGYSQGGGEDDYDEESRLLGVLEGAFPGEEEPMYGWGSSTGPREGKDGGVTESVEQALSHGSATLVIRCLYLLAQGILAGFSFVTVYSLTSFDNDEDFLLNYQSTANEARRFFYILSTVALAGGLDACLDVFAPSSTDVMALVDGGAGGDGVPGARRAGQEGGGGDKGGEDTAYTSTADRPTGAVQVYGLSKARGGPVLLLVGMVVLYVLCLLCSLLMAPHDVLIYNKNDEEGEDWPRLALQDAGFRDGLDTWKSLAAVRLASALGAWLIVCILTWSNLAVSLRLIDLVVRLRQMVVRRKNRICELEGDGDVLSELPESRLRELIETQRVGLQRSEEELKGRVGCIE